MRRSVLPTVVGALTSMLCARSASATDCSGILSPCINDDTLWPHPGPATFEFVGSTDTVAARQLGFGLVSTYLFRPVTLHLPSPGGAGSDQYAISDQADGTFLWAYGVTDRLELDLALPVTFGQGGTGLTPLTGGPGLKDTAVRDFRYGFAFRWLGVPGHDGWAGVARFEVSAPSGDRSQFAGESAAVLVPSLAIDGRAGRWFAGAEVGVRARPPTQLLQARVGSQLSASLGVGYRILPQDRLSIEAEAWALPSLVAQATLAADSPYASQAGGGSLVPAEWQVSARTAPIGAGDVSFQLGGGGRIPLGDSGLTSPGFRLVLAIRWAPLGRERPAQVAGAETRAEGTPPVPLPLEAGNDACVEEPDPVDGFDTERGCPDADQDKDGIDDRFDRCPLVPEDFAGLTDGCPEKK
ncbi:MAG TPA: hypothetical protein VKU41_17065 [Polyangiaceae bacterium]|nr:hypothetical protein [Polyangiaceae bacterium]